MSFVSKKLTEKAKGLLLDPDNPGVGFSLWKVYNPGEVVGTTAPTLSIALAGDKLETFVKQELGITLEQNVEAFKAKAVSDPTAYVNDRITMSNDAARTAANACSDYFQKLVQAGMPVHKAESIAMQYAKEVYRAGMAIDTLMTGGADVSDAFAAGQEEVVRHREGVSEAALGGSISAVQKRAIIDEYKERKRQKKARRTAP